MIVHGEGERYVVSMIDGYDISAARPGERGHRGQSYVILDSHYCYRAVWRCPRNGFRRTAERHGFVGHPGYSRWKCDRMNEEDARGRVE